MIKKIVVFSMMAMMAITSLYGCGGGGSDNNDVPVINPGTGNVISVAPTGTVVATAASEQFNLVAPTATAQERTISGFEYGKDLIAVPSTAPLNAAPLTAGDSTSTNSVDLNWTVDGKTVVVHMTNLNAQTVAQLKANSDYTKIFTNY
jgi:hypothetical protein